MKNTIIASSLVLILILAGTVVGQSLPTTVLINGTVLTVDADFSTHDAMAIRGNRILAVGDPDTVLQQAGGDSTIIDVAGKTILPAFSRGIQFSLHTDFSVSELSPLEMVEIAVTRTLFSEPDYVLGKQECASVEAALRGVTSVPAWQLQSENEIGSLEPGKLADFVVLDADPRKVEPEKIDEIRVMETWINGKKVYQNRSSQETHIGETMEKLYAVQN